MSNNYKGYNLFNDVDNVKLRAWNRCATFFTIYRTLGKEEAKSYTSQLDDIGRTQMQNMLAEIREDGYGNVRKSVVDSHRLG